jgi:uncharacterized protein (TIGR00369 family)
MATTVNVTELQELLDNSPFVKVYNFKVVSLGDGEATVLFPFDKTFERPGGYVSGPVYMAAADLAMWLAIITKVGLEEGLMDLTLEMKTNFLTGAKAEDVLCTAKVLKVGRRIIYGVADCSTPEGKLCTHHTLTYMRTGKGEHD